MNQTVDHAWILWEWESPKCAKNSGLRNYKNMFSYRLYSMLDCRFHYKSLNVQKIWEGIWPPPTKKPKLGGGFKYFSFLLLLGDMIQFDYFWNGLKPPTSKLQNLRRYDWMSREKKLVHDCLGAALTLDERNPKTKLTCLPLRNNVNMVQPFFCLTATSLAANFHYISMEVVFFWASKRIGLILFLFELECFLEFPCPAI